MAMGNLIKYGSIFRINIPNVVLEKTLKSSTRGLSIVYINNIAIWLAMMDHHMVAQSDIQRTQTMHQKDN